MNSLSLTRRHPMVVALIITAIFSGVAGIIREASGATATHTLLPPVMAAIFDLLLIVGGVIVLFGIFRDQGIMIERGGLWILGGNLLVNGMAALIISDDANTLSSEFLLIAVGVGCLWRAWHITLDIRSRVEEFHHIRGD